MPCSQPWSWYCSSNSYSSNTSPSIRISFTKQDIQTIITCTKDIFLLEHYTMQEKHIASSLGLVFPSNSARNACWRFLASSLGLVFPSNGTRNAVMIFLNKCRRNPQARGYIVVAFSPGSIQVSFIYIFPKEGMI